MQVGDWVLVKGEGDAKYTPRNWVGIIGAIVKVTDVKIYYRVKDEHRSWLYTPEEIIPLNQIPEDQLGIYLSLLGASSAQKLLQFLKSQAEGTKMDSEITKAPGFDFPGICLCLL